MERFRLLSVSYTYAASGRLASADGNLGGTSYTYADTISYTAAGQITKERFGTTKLVGKIVLA